MSTEKRNRFYGNPHFLECLETLDPVSLVNSENVDMFSIIKTHKQFLDPEEIECLLSYCDLYLQEMREMMEEEEEKVSE